jgi:pimeloyl-ACP methyl ester carboxylesterase
VFSIISQKELAGSSFPEGIVEIRYRGCDGFEDRALLLPGNDPKRALVVIHGHGATEEQLYTRPDIRERSLTQYRETGATILTVNLRGNAWMGPKAADDLHSLLNFLRENRSIGKFVFCSGSMGGTSNLIYAILFPDDVSGVVARGAATDLASFHDWCLLQDLPICRQIAEAIRISYSGTPAENPSLYRRHSALCNCHRLTMPVFLSHGGADRIIPVSEARNLAAAMEKSPQFRYREIEGGNHDSPLWLDGDLEWVLENM